MTENNEEKPKTETAPANPPPVVSLTANPPPSVTAPPQPPANSATPVTPPPSGNAQSKVTEPGTEDSASKSEKKDKQADDAEPGSMRPEQRPHAFVVMPFGKKKGANDQPFDFNAIYRRLIKPALEEAGFEPFRADEETSSGDILTDMFQELLLADMVICDLSIDNANAFYELGIRHALRKRGVVHIQAGRAYMPFDIFNVRTYPYHITSEGLPDPEYIRSDIKAIARMLKDTWASDRDAVHSPIYNLLTGLKEPDRKSLKTHLATGFWREYNDWKDKVTVAQRQKHIGDILLLTEEIQNPLIREEAASDVGRALAALGRYELALSQYRKGLEINSSNLEFRREEAFHLNRLGRVDEAIVKIEGILAEFPTDSKSITYLGRIYKEMWTASWIDLRDNAKRLKRAFESYHWLIKAVDIYIKGFKIDLNDAYPGINAFTLSHIAVHLADRFDSKKSPDPDITRIRNLIPSLRDTLLFGLESRIALEQEKADYWTLISLAELRLLTATELDEVVRSYRKAITASRRNIFSLNSSLSQLEILKAVGLRTEFVQAIINLFKEEISKVNSGDVGFIADEGKSKMVGRVLLFSGYMVDYSNKEKKFFPSENEGEIRQEIRKKIEKFSPGPHDRAIMSGLSAGSEIIFAELCIEAGINLKIYLAHSEASFVREFVSPVGEGWVDRFYKVTNNPMVDCIYQKENLGEPKEGDDLYERNNRWALYSSIGRVGIQNVRMLAVATEFTGETRDPDIRNTRHMIELMRNAGGQIDLINPSKFIYNVIDSALEKLIQNGVNERQKQAALPAQPKSQLVKKARVKKD